MHARSVSSRLGHRAIAFICCLTIVSGADKAENVTQTAEKWREDLHFLATELPKRHESAFNFTPKPKFDAAVMALDNELSTLDGDAVYVRLLALTSMIGDAHTYLRVPQSYRNFPLGFRKFGSDYRVFRTAAGNEKWLGAVLVKIADMPVQELEQRIEPLTPRNETPYFTRGLVAGYLSSANVLHGLGVL